MASSRPWASGGTRTEGELIGTEDESLVVDDLEDLDLADRWCRKTRTLLRRLAKRVEQSSDSGKVVVEAAAVLGLLEAMRRAEDTGRWSRVDAEFVDREALQEFLMESIPRLLGRTAGF